MTAEPPTFEVLKRDVLGTVSLVHDGADRCVRRDTGSASPWARKVARRLARREAAALAAGEGIEGIPRLLGFDGRCLARTYIPGVPMHHAQPRSAAYFTSALRLLRCVHGRGIAHNDLAKEANWLCTPDGRAAIVDFQIAVVHPPGIEEPGRGRTGLRRGRLFRSLAREDLRHLLKHKRTYLPERLTARQRALLADPSILTRLWRTLAKPCYRLVTRRLLGWQERSGPHERQDSKA